MLPPRLGFLTCQQRIRWLCPAHFGSEGGQPRETGGPSKGPGSPDPAKCGVKQRASRAGAVGSAKSSPGEKWAGPCRSPAPGPALPAVVQGRPDPATHRPVCSSPISRTHRAFWHLPSPVAGCAPFCRLLPLVLGAPGVEIEGGRSAHTTRVIFSGPHQPLLLPRRLRAKTQLPDRRVN